MIRNLSCLLIWGLLIQTTVAQSEPQDEHDSSKWESKIQAFEDSDNQNMPPQHAVLFVGSSSIRLWDLAESFPKLVTINRGFGGSQLADSVQFIDRIVLKHEPSAIVMYAGDNDLNAGKSPERVFADFAEFVAILQKHAPQTPLHYIAIKPSIKRWNLIDQVRRTNRLISSYCDLNDKLFFVDIDSPMLNPDRTLNKSLFAKDGLHLNKSGYRLWTKTLNASLGKSGARRLNQSSFDQTRHRVFVLTDIPNESDDEQPLVRLLLQSN